MTRWRSRALVLMFLFTHLIAAAGPLRFQISGLAADDSSVGLALNFINGDAPASRLDVYGFAGDGTLGAVSILGHVSGSLTAGFRSQDSGFLSELVLSFTGGDSLSFLFDISAAAPGGGALADAFPVFLIDVVTGVTLLDTTDGSGANALFPQVVNGNDNGLLEACAPSFAPDVQWSVLPQGTPGGVPEPSTLAVAVPWPCC